jgi:hypothetical protein
MRKISFLVGAGIGFVVGSRAGRGPYEQLEANVRKVLRRPEVEKAVDQVKEAAGDAADSAAQKVTAAVPSPDKAKDSENGPHVEGTPGGTTSSTPSPTSSSRGGTSQPSGKGRAAS